jgi:hypothetical protein
MTSPVYDGMWGHLRVITLDYITPPQSMWYLNTCSMHHPYHVYL